MAFATSAPRPLRLGLFALAVLAVLWGSLSPVTALPSVSLWDKAQHALGYLALALLGAWAFAPLGRLAAGLVLMGLAVEVLQATMNLGRQGDLADGLANTVGVLAGVSAAWLVRRR